MNKYNASSTPNPEEWLSLSESEQIDLVVAFVEKSEKDIETPAIRIHASIHVIFENQLAKAIEPTPDVYARLRKQGLSRHEAIHAIGAVIAEEMFGIMKASKDDVISRYKDRLNKLTAKRWLKGKY